jgi:lipopolysaccharide/colanic/teichoic acid biosynthesis glycosyltransferase
MKIQFFIFLTNAILINLGLLISFSLRYGSSIPQRNFLPYKNSFIFLTLIYLLALLFFGVYKNRFKSSWDLFKRIFSGLFLGTLLNFVFMYVFRIKWGAFPTTIFIISFAINLLMIFKFNQWFLKRYGRIKKHVIVLGKSEIKCSNGKICIISRTTLAKFKILQIKFNDIDQIIVAEEIEDINLMEYLILIIHRFKIDLVYTPTLYMKMIHKRLNGNDQQLDLKTFEGERRDAEELLIRLVDIAISLCGLTLLSPIAGLVTLAIKATSLGPAIYKQIRVGKDGKQFVMYKFRTMYQDSEKLNGFQPAVHDDPRITWLGKWLRQSRLDEIPQLVNILIGDMSLVGPRPENVFRVNSHKALQGIRLAVKPGLTGLAQIRSFYDLEPQHKIKYDYLYIQRRSLQLNLYILLYTIPSLISKKGW